MRSKKIWALVLLNVTLLATLCLPNPFTGVAKAAGARPSEYLMVSGEVQGGVSGVVFAVDTRNQMLTAFTLDATSKKIEAMPSIDLKRISRSVYSFLNTYDMPGTWNVTSPRALRPTLAPLALPSFSMRSIHSVGNQCE